MNNKEFVKIIKEIVSVAAVEGTIENLKEPPGRKPHPKLLQQSEWFLILNDQDQEMVTQLLVEAVDEAVFGFFCVLDGVRSISNDVNESKLKLICNGQQLNYDVNRTLRRHERLAHIFSQRSKAKCLQKRKRKSYNKKYNRTRMKFM